MKLIDCRHPTYYTDYAIMERYRYIIKGGDTFINKYLYKFTEVETDTDFTLRRYITYNIDICKSTINDFLDPLICNIFKVIRESESESYNRCILGKDGGVDNLGNSINNFMINSLLFELCFMGKVGVFLDNVSNEIKSNNHPYIYIYKFEDILSWNFDITENKFKTLLLKNSRFKINAFGLVDSEIVDEYLYFVLNEFGTVTYYTYDMEGKELNSEIIDLPYIPFRMFEIKKSLLTDVDKCQIALLNTSSSDLNYILKANFPFYTEQFDPAAEGIRIKKIDDEGNEINDEKIQVGVTKGRKYSKNLERPGFIHPSSEPLTASMKKQEEIKKEVREIIKNNISDNGEGKSDLSSGLLVISNILEYCEKFIVDTWSDYEKVGKNKNKIIYPKDFILSTTENLIINSKNILDIVKEVPSNSLKKELLVKVAELLIKNDVSNEQLNKIKEEIRTSNILELSAETIKNDHESGFVSTETASKLRGYDVGEVEQAKIDHAERLARIAAAQTSPGVRGINDTFENPKQNLSDEKKIQQNTDDKDVPEDQTRGEGK